MDEGPRPLIGLALSGGGSRAMAFQLGCLRALDEAGILGRVRVISAVSGGSVLAALYCTRTESFADFERRAARVLRQGIAGTIARSIFSLGGANALIAFGVSGLSATATQFAKLASAMAPLAWRQRAVVRR